MGVYETSYQTKCDIKYFAYLLCADFISLIDYERSC